MASSDAQISPNITASPQPLPVEICDPDGDLRLTAPLLKGGLNQQKCFTVSSKAMRLACVPWKKMLEPGSLFTEAKKLQQGELSLPADDAAPLATLLHIAHLDFDKIPQHMDFHDLLDLAVLTDKYCATKLVRPWIKTWIADVQHLLLRPGYEEWLWIAWEFGQQASFEELAMHLVKNVALTEDGRCPTLHGRVLDPLSDSCHLPPVIMEGIMNARQKAMHDLFEIYRDTMKEFRTCRANKPSGTCCSNPHTVAVNRRECDILTYGSINLSLSEAGLNLGKSWETKKNCSVQGLSQKLFSQVVMGRHGCWSGTCKNAELKEKLRSSVQVMLEKIPSPLTDSDIRHLERQAAACGYSTD